MAEQSSLEELGQQMLAITKEVNTAPIDDDPVIEFARKHADRVREGAAKLCREAMAHADRIMETGIKEAARSREILEGMQAYSDALAALDKKKANGS